MSMDWPRRRPAFRPRSWLRGGGKARRMMLRMAIVPIAAFAGWIVVTPGFGAGTTPPPSPSWTCDASAVKVLTGGTVTADPLSANTNPIDGRCHPDGSLAGPIKLDNIFGDNTVTAEADTAYACTSLTPMDNPTDPFSSRTCDPLNPITDAQTPISSLQPEAKAGVENLHINLGGDAGLTIH